MPSFSYKTKVVAYDGRIGTVVAIYRGQDLCTPDRYMVEFQDGSRTEYLEWQLSTKTHQGDGRFMFLKGERVYYWTLDGTVPDTMKVVSATVTNVAPNFDGYEVSYVDHTLDRDNKIRCVYTTGFRLLPPRTRYRNMS